MSTVALLAPRSNYRLTSSMRGRFRPSPFFFSLPHLSTLSATLCGEERSPCFSTLVWEY